MKLKKNCYAVNSYNQAFQVISICNEIKIIPILFIKYFLINGFGIYWLTELNRLLIQKFKSNKFKIYVDIGKNYGMCIDLIENNIQFIKVEADTETLKKLKQIAKINKVLLNPKFSIVDLSKTKNIKVKIQKNII